MNRKGHMHPICTQKPGRFSRVFVCAHTNALFELFVVIFVILGDCRKSHFKTRDHFSYFIFQFA